MSPKIQKFKFQYKNPIDAVNMVDVQPTIQEKKDIIQQKDETPIDYDFKIQDLPQSVITKPSLKLELVSKIPESYRQKLTNQVLQKKDFFEYLIQIQQQNLSLLKQELKASDEFVSMYQKIYESIELKTSKQPNTNKSLFFKQNTILALKEQLELKKKNLKKLHYFNKNLKDIDELVKKQYPVQFHKSIDQNLLQSLSKSILNDLQVEDSNIIRQSIKKVNSEVNSLEETKNQLWKLTQLKQNKNSLTEWNLKYELIINDLI